MKTSIIKHGKFLLRNYNHMAMHPELDIRKGLISFDINSASKPMSSKRRTSVTVYTAYHGSGLLLSNPSEIQSVSVASQITVGKTIWTKSARIQKTRQKL